MDGHKFRIGQSVTYRSRDADAPQGVYVIIALLPQREDGANSQVTTGWGVGGSVLLRAVPQILDLQGSVLYGKGIGRSGASQLSDVVVASDGTLSAITAIHALVGAVLHPLEGTDIYGYAAILPEPGVVMPVSRQQSYCGPHAQKVSRHRPARRSSLLCLAARLWAPLVKQ
jgi:hypothetical protein